jgi:hypothetical protein
MHHGWPFCQEPSGSLPGGTHRCFRDEYVLYVGSVNYVHHASGSNLPAVEQINSAWEAIDLGERTDNAAKVSKLYHPHVGDDIVATFVTK